MVAACAHMFVAGSAVTLFGPSSMFLCFQMWYVSLFDFVFDVEKNPS